MIPYLEITSLIRLHFNLKFQQNISLETTVSQVIGLPQTENQSATITATY